MSHKSNHHNDKNDMREDKTKSVSNKGAGRYHNFHDYEFHSSPLEHRAGSRQGQRLRDFMNRVRDYNDNDEDEED